MISSTQVPVFRNLVAVGYVAITGGVEGVGPRVGASG